MISYMEQLIKMGLAYADCTGGEEMKLQRDEGIESKYRPNSVEENLAKFKLMRAGPPSTKDDKKDSKKPQKGGKGKEEEKKKPAE
jgi:glutamyl/glutaminyl-tRNA synthetase